MDTSKEYIEMCRKASEVQKYEEEFNQKDSLINNLYATWEDGSVGFGQSIIPKGGMKIGTIAIWLPRQDQLQNIIKEKEPSYSQLALLNLMNEFFEVFRKKPLADMVHFVPQSFEQWWLLIVMKFCFDKEWNYKTKTWIKIN